MGDGKSALKISRVLPLEREKSPGSNGGGFNKIYERDQKIIAFKDY